MTHSPVSPGLPSALNTGSKVLPGNEGNLVLNREWVASGLGTVSGAGQRKNFPSSWEAYLEVNDL